MLGNWGKGCQADFMPRVGYCRSDTFSLYKVQLIELILGIFPLSLFHRLRNQEFSSIMRISEVSSTQKRELKGSPDQRDPSEQLASHGDRRSIRDRSMVNSIGLLCVRLSQTLGDLCVEGLREHRGDRIANLLAHIMRRKGEVHWEGLEAGNLARSVWSHPRGVIVIFSTTTSDCLGCSMAIEWGTVNVVPSGQPSLNIMVLSIVRDATNGRPDGSTGEKSRGSNQAMSRLREMGEDLSRSARAVSWSVMP